MEVQAIVQRVVGKNTTKSKKKMSKNLDNLLIHFGIEATEVETIKQALLSDGDADDAIQIVLKGAQSYAKPFIDGEYQEQIKKERGTYKGKYLKEALLKANQVFGNALTNKEIDDILNDPANQGKNIDVALEALKTKVSSKSDTPEAELQKMLDVANNKIHELETTIPKIKEEAELSAKQAVEKFKLDGVVTTKLLQVLSDKVDNPAKIAELLKGQLSAKAMLKLKEDGNIGLYDIANPDTPLKKNETTLHSFEGLIDEMVNDYGLSKKSNGTTKVVLGGNEPTKPNEIKTGASGLEAKLAQLAGA